MSFIVVIPARYASSRLPGKPLVDIAGKSMIQRVYEQAQKTAADQVYVATDDQRVEEEVQTWGGNVLMTNASHQSGTDRLAEVAQKLNLAEDHILVNLQGDEPLMPPEVIDQVAANLQSHPECPVATLCEPIQLKEDFLNPAVVKVVADANNMALYFSRAPIPWPRDLSFDSATLPENLNARRHLGIYAYRAGFLQQFVSWPVAELESLEMLEQLRVLVQGKPIHVELSCAEVPAGIDTQEDLERVRGLLAK
jgi:3-deoxy-manno-octulosonate cytidylyltransferase (CMP-KDO synthetase)